MNQRVLATIAVPLMILWAFGCSSSTDNSSSDQPEDASPSAVEVGELLYPTTSLAELAPGQPPGGVSADPIIIPDCRLTRIIHQHHRTGISGQRRGARS